METQLPKELADVVKKEAERLAETYGTYPGYQSGFIAGASFLYSIQPESESEKVIKEKDDYIRYLQARINQLVKNREIVHSENERLTVGYWEQVLACEKLRAIQPTCRWVKASERMPVEKKQYCIRETIHGSLCYSVAYFGFDELITDDYEWLEEELPSPPKETEQTGVAGGN